MKLDDKALMDVAALGIAVEVFIILICIWGYTMYSIYGRKTSLGKWILRGYVFAGSAAFLSIFGILFAVFAE